MQQEKVGHIGGLVRTAAAKRELNELCRDLVSREIEKGRLTRPLSIRRLRRWVAKQVVRRVGLRGENLKMRWRQAALAAILMSGMVLYSGTEAKAAVKFADNGLLQGINVGYAFKPVFADIDGDGDLDLFVGEYYGTIKYYVNDGTGVLTEQTGTWDPITKAGNPFDGISVGYNSAPTFADIDGDGDLDLFVGSYDGPIHYYVNDGTGVFTEQTGPWASGAGNPFDGITIGYYSALAFADLDNNGDLDAFIVDNSSSTIKYYVNDGTGVFTEQTGTWDPSTKLGNPFDGITVGYGSNPVFADIDGDGDLDAFIGDYSGTIKYYRNDGTGGFTLDDGDWNPFLKTGNPLKVVNVGAYNYSAPAFADIDGDGDLDAFIGDVNGQISYFKNVMLGDVAAPIGVVNSADALKALRIAAGIIPVTPSYLESLDVAPLVNGVPNPDGTIDLGDVVVVLRLAVGLL